MLRYLIVIVLLMHGLGHIMPFMAAWTPSISKAGFSSAPWIFPGGFDLSSPVGQVFGLLGLVALIGFVAGALGLLTHRTWWPAMLLAAAAISMVTIVPWANTWPVGSLIGALLVDAIVIGALISPWEEQLSHALSSERLPGQD